MRKPALLAWSSALAFMLAGCGQTQDQSVSTVFSQESTGINSQGVPVSGTQAIATFAQAFGALQDYTAQLDTLAAQDENDDNPEQSTSNYSFKKARWLRVDIVQSNVQNQAGSTVVWKGAPQARVKVAKPIPLLGSVFTLAITDSRLTSPRGLRLDQSDMVATVQRLQQPGVQATVTGTDTVDGRPVTVVTATGGWAGIDDGITQEQLSFDQQTGLLVRDISYIGQKVVTNLTLTHLQVNVGLADSIFDL